MPAVNLDQDLGKKGGRGREPKRDRWVGAWPVGAALWRRQSVRTRVAVAGAAAAVQMREVGEESVVVGDWDAKRESSGKGPLRRSPLDEDIDA